MQVQGGVQDDAVVVGVLPVAVGIPVLLADVDLHVPLHHPLILEVKQGVAEVRSGRRSGTPGIQHPHPPPLAGAEPLLPRRPPLPQLRQRALRQRGSSPGPA